MGLKMIFYLTNVTNAVNLSQPGACIGGGLLAPFFRTALSKPRNLSYFPLKIRSRPKKGENRPRLRTKRLDSWVSKSPGSEKTPPRRQPEIFLRNGINLLELRPSKNTVTPLGTRAKFCYKLGTLGARSAEFFWSYPIIIRSGAAAPMPRSTKDIM